MSSEFVQSILIRVRSDGEVVIKKIADDMNQLGQSAKSAKAGANEFGDALGAFGSKLAAWAAGIFTVAKAVEGLRAGMAHYDEAKTLTSAISALTGSAKTAADTMAYFEKVSGQTANTGTELARVFRDVLPMSIRAGLNVTQVRDMTVLLGELAKSGLATSDALGNAFARLMTGHLRTNELLLITGTRIEDITKGTDEGLAKIAERIVRTGMEFAKTPDTFEIAGKRIKDAMLDAFAAGLAGAQGTQLGIEGMKQALMDPKLLQAIRDIGELFGKIVPIVTMIAGFVSDLAKTGPKWLDSIRSALPGIGRGMGLGILGPEFGTGGGAAGGWGGGTGAGLPTPAGGAGETPEEQAKRMVETVTKALKRARDAFQATQAQWTSDIEKANAALVELQRNIDAVSARTGGMQGAWTAYAQQIFDVVGEYMRLNQEFPKGWEEAYNWANKVLSAIFMQEEEEKRLKAELEEAARAEEHAAELRLRSLIAETGQANELAEALNRAYGERRHRLEGMPGVSMYDIERLQALFEDAQRRLLDAAELGLSPEAMQRIKDAFDLSSRVLVNQAQRAAQEFLRAFEQFKGLVVDPLEDALTDLITTGGENLGQIMGRAMGQAVSYSIKEFMPMLFGGQAPKFNPTTGMWEYGGKPWISEQYAREAQVQQGFKGVGGLAAAAGGGYAFGATSSASDLATGLSSAIGGLPLLSGGLYGVIAYVLLQVGTAIGKIFQASKGASYGFGVPTFTAGGPGGFAFSFAPGETGGVQNIPTAKAKEMEAQVRTQVEAIWTTYLDILIKVGAKVFPTISESIASWAAKAGGDVEKGYDFGKEASENYWNHWEQWVNGTLPRAIAKTFYEPLEKAFVGFGGTAERFEQLWAEWDRLDPKKAAELWASVFDTLISMVRPLEYFKTPVFGDILSFGARKSGQIAPGVTSGLLDASSLWNATIADKYQSFQDSVRDINERIFQLGDAFGSMTSQQQVEAAKEIADLMNQKMQKEKEFLRSLLDMLEQAARTKAQTIEAWQTQGMTDQERYEYYQKEVEKHRAAIATARTPTEAMQAYNDFMEDMNRLFSAGIAAGVDPKKLFATASKLVEDAFNDLAERLHAFGTSIEDENRTFVEKFQPIYDTWLSKIDSSSSNIGALGDSAATASGSLDAMTAAADAATESLLALAGAAAATAGGNFQNYVLQSRGVAA